MSKSTITATKAVQLARVAYGTAAAYLRMQMGGPGVIRRWEELQEREQRAISRDVALVATDRLETEYHPQIEWMASGGAYRNNALVTPQAVTKAEALLLLTIKALVGLEEGEDHDDGLESLLEEEVKETGMQGLLKNVKKLIEQTKTLKKEPVHLTRYVQIERNEAGAIVDLIPLPEDEIEEVMSMEFCGYKRTIGGCAGRLQARDVLDLKNPIGPRMVG